MPIVLDHLSHTYFDGTTSVPAVKDVSFEIREGEFLSIIGHTGCGKTTMVQHLNGLLLPSGGRVLVDGMDTADKKLRPAIRSLVGMVFQYPEYQLFADTVREDVGFGPKNMKLSEEEIALRVSEAMAMVGLSLEEFGEKSPFELSGGEKRRAALAGILAMRPKYLVLDEPMAGLDPQGRQSILGMLEKLRQETGCSIIMVSHSMEDVARHADRILVMNRGEVMYLDTPKTVFSHSEELAEMGLSLPAPCRVAALLRAKGKDVPLGICTREDLEESLLRRMGA
ncbi:MAG: energy-coupling factor transporter ATPase [Clostridia bacterium]|nr:energy-coupling factor transporter ATPase [Clostridia bacterium]MBQ3652604.1 energy-coupling factor transporter ATPase [Clostridia bacterium]MBQ6866456.1 energy-coupling factor transporter ATPase [Clostridia bacterium]MBQ7755289.1 energy-coupling factor transporter ATPase [Clostridia bacterium]MBQ9924291.1 energy-coupling factor transporter ATPase [Clostridia bacterium]